MRAPVLSVIIVTYNSEAVIISCLDSLHASAPDAEVIIIDNHSTDATAARIEAYIRERPAAALTLIRSPRNCGFARAVNIGLTRAKGEAVMLLGPDVRLFPGTTGRLMRCLTDDERVGIAAPRLIDEHGHTRPSVRKPPGFSDLWLELSGLPRLLPGRITAAWKAPGFDYSRSGPARQPEASCLLCRMTAVAQVGPMDVRFTMFFNDVDWCRRFRENGWSIHYCHDAPAFHAGGHAVYQHRIPMIWKSHQAFYRYLKKYTHSRSGRIAVAAAGLSLVIAAAVRSLLRSMLFRKKKPVHM
ncbi:glycosyltransferase family 2 protein [bacterium]|nr:glycosyltransferase family 2 protein [bacterium]